MQKFRKVLETDDVDLAALRKLSWTGIPPALRGKVWKLLLGYIPTRSRSQATCLERKRREYRDLIPRYFEEEDYYNEGSNTNNNDDDGTGENHDRPLPPSFISRSTEEQQVLRQVESF